MRRLSAVFVAMVLLSLAPGWASAGNKIELTESEMDEVSAAGADGFLGVLLLQNPWIRSIALATNSPLHVTVNGVTARTVNTSSPPNSSFQPIALINQTKGIGTQNGLSLPLIQKTNSSVYGFQPPVPLTPPAVPTVFKFRF